jgi:hypothetical protein
MAVITLTVVMMALSVGLGLYTLGDAIISGIKAWWRRGENITYCRLWSERSERDDLPGYQGRIY